MAHLSIHLKSQLSDSRDKELVCVVRFICLYLHTSHSLYLMCTQGGIKTFLPRPNQFTPNQQNNQGLVSIWTKILSQFSTLYLSHRFFAFVYYLFVVVYSGDAWSFVYK